MDMEKVIKGLNDIGREIINTHGHVDAIPYLRTIDDAIALLKEQEKAEGKFTQCKVKTPTGKWNGEECSVCGAKYIGSATLHWKFCPDCGAQMEGRDS